MYRNGRQAGAKKDASTVRSVFVDPGSWWIYLWGRICRWDNAKKYIESGAREGHGKGSAAHKAAVTGDTVGDTRKDVVGVALDIFIKSMSTVANTLAPIFSHVAR